ncbi:hypothetical protein HZZ00_18920 [Streptomyces sp. NEAU-sy36]|uniref:hypothetical protein n=1 Tax=unclassified Streptomyces TaxID=2593676 RepID=UPI0015D5FE16|nr:MULTISPECIES: hypothetical protein [unclassified Streptomyces]QLJ02878.1 hypothetical protein HZZ00_18920 [Streptomyces sp. NEAU-sy36]
MNTRRYVAALATAAALAGGIAAAAPAQAATSTYYINTKSLSGNTQITGTYRYRVTGWTSSGEAIYGGSFSNTGARDRISGNGLQAVFALSYYSWSGGAWHYHSRYAVKVNSFGSWTFNNKKNIKPWACDRKVGTTKLINCRAPWK